MAWDWNAAIEECARLCEGRAIYYKDTQPIMLVDGKDEPVGKLYAAAIRELKRPDYNP